jgi:tRNA A-37 threonylcarbamoyl transferase component Bud32
MELLSQSAYEKLIFGAQSLSHDTIDGKISHKVLRLENQSILKLFRVKHLISSTRLFPYVKRFQNNAVRLASLNIPTVQVSAVYRIPSIKRTAVHYYPLDGITLREYFNSTPIDDMLSKKLGSFLHSLHKQGIYFRSVHFGNIVLTPDNRIGLIDVADMRFSKGPLTTTRRIRNLRHFFRYHSDTEMLSRASECFLDIYCRKARLSRRSEIRFRRHFESYFQNCAISGKKFI